MNAEKLQKLQAQVRLGGKGTARRKKKVVHRTATTDDKKLQSSLKKLSVRNNFHFVGPLTPIMLKGGGHCRIIFPPADFSLVLHMFSHFCLISRQ